MFICGGASVPPSLIRRATGYFERAVVTPGVRIDRGPGDDGRRTARRPGRTRPTPTAPGHRRRPAGRSGWHGHPARSGAGAQMLRRLPASRGRGRILRRGRLFPHRRPRPLGRRRLLVVTGRAKDIIIRNGENISPKEVEDILIGHPDIAEVAVVGAARCAYRRAGLRGDRARDAIPARTSERTARVPARHTAWRGSKSPSGWSIWDALPKNDAGKVLKHQIRAWTGRAKRWEGGE